MTDEFTTPDLEGKVRQLIEASSRRDFDAAFAMFSDGAVWDRRALGMEVIEGREAIRGFFEEWVGAYDDYAIELEEVRDMGNAVTFAALRQRGRPTGSSEFLELRYALVATLVDGHVERLTSYLDPDEARAAAELLAEEQG